MVCKGWPFADRGLLALGLATALLLGGCANSIPPQGGPQDETPPQLDSSASTPNFQTRFEKQPIDLVFDEWIELQDVATQVVISPPVDNYDIKMRRKGIRFTFGEEEVLRDSATYTINFGSAIQDLTEGNAAENLRFVFSTGDVLDSLEVRGRVIDALTGEAVAGSLFLLYENTADSVVRTERPFYFARTDTAGRFAIQNVKGGLFKGFALTDSRPNYRFDPGEAIGFPDSLIRLEPGPIPELEIVLFQEFDVPRLIDEELDEFGRVKLVFDGPPEGIEVSTPNGPPLLTETVRDTLIAWYGEPTEATWNLVYRLDTLLEDTLRVAAQDGANWLRDARLRRQPAPEQISVNPRRPLWLGFNHPLVVADSTRARLRSDSLPGPVVPQLRIDTADFRRLQVDYNWSSGYTYQLELLPGALFDLYGIGNGDTLRVALDVLRRSDFGNINLEVTGLDSLQAYVVQLRDNNENVVEERAFRDQPFFSETFELLPPGTYEVRLITDRNGNGKWDTGNYDLKRQPEPIFLRTLEQLRANWDLDARIDFVDGPLPGTGS